MKINPQVKKGDVVILLAMAQESMMPGTKGIVQSVQNVFGSDMIYVDWENGRKLSLLGDVDAWTVEEPKNIDEAYNDKWLSQNLDIMNFDTNTLVNFLLKIKESGITNMFGASPYLYMGKDRIQHQFAYTDFSEDQQERFDEMLEYADSSQNAMIQGVIKVLDKENKELSIDNINRYLQKYSSKILMHYINVLS